MKSRMDVERMEAGSSDPAELLRAELMAVEPSPAFAAGVRARVAARLAGPSTLWLNGAAVVAVMAVMAVATPRENAEPRPRPAEPVAVALPVPAELPVSVPAVRRVVATRATPEPAIAEAAESRFEVLVPPDQAMAVKQIMARYAAGLSARVPTPGTKTDEMTGELLEPEPVHITPVRIEPLLKFEFFWGGKLR